MRSHRRGCRAGRSGGTGGGGGRRRRSRLLENEVLQSHFMHARESVHRELQRSHGLVKDLRMFQLVGFLVGRLVAHETHTM